LIGYNRNSLRNYTGYFYVLPALIFMTFFIGLPVIQNIILSFQDVDVMTVKNRYREFIGLKNYVHIFKDPLLIQSIMHTFYYTAGSIVFQFTIGFALALLFKNKFFLAKPIKGFSIITWMIPMTVTALMFKFMFSTNGGIINEILLFTGIINKPVEWLQQPTSAMWSLIITNVWVGIPFNMVLLSTGLTTIPEEFYESACIDGANPFQRFAYITLPLLKPSIKSVLTLGFIYIQGFRRSVHHYTGRTCECN
jgi:multiple sugar transport system permease protein